MSTPSQPPTPTWRLQLARVVALLFVVGLTVLIYIYRDQAQALAQFGYVGIFIFSILANATLVLPAPQLIVIAAMGQIFWPVGVGIAAGLGATLGELSGYLAGFSGQAVIENRKLYDQLEGWMKRYGSIVIAVLGFLPLPFFDLAGIAAGALKMPVLKFLFWCTVGKIPKMILVAYAGAYSIDWITRWFS
jgi:uncharacterized membrane protein YdjX (TVP38/TMEM64 family)